jgi:hypothetical protein
MYLAQMSDSLRVFLLIIPSLALPLIGQTTRNNRRAVKGGVDSGYHIS